MKLSKITGFVFKAAILCALSAALAVAFNMVRPEPHNITELSKPQPPGIAEMDTPAMLEAYDSGNVSVIDARSDMEFAMGHIPGALNIPSYVEGDELTGMIAPLGQDGQVIIYCDGLACGKSLILGKKMIEKGFRNVAVYTDGLDGWLSAGRDLEVN